MDMAEGSVGVLIDDPTIGTEGQLSPLALMVSDCLTKQPCRWKLVSRNSLSEPPG